MIHVTCGGGSESSSWLASNAVAIVAFLLAYLAARTTIRSKQADFIIFDQKAFDDLLKAKGELHAKKLSQDELTREGKLLFERWWNLFHAEFIGWQQGFVRTDLLHYWLATVQAELVAPTSDWTFGNCTLTTSLDDHRERWDEARNFAIGESAKYREDMLDLMNRLRSGEKIAAKELRRIYGPCAAIQLTRWIFGAL
jgi:hypothetical protein